MAKAVLLTHDATQDLEDLLAYIARKDSPARATHVLTRIARALASLAHAPQRGAFPPELLALGVRQYREVFFKP